MIPFPCPICRDEACRIFPLAGLFEPHRREFSEVTWAATLGTMSPEQLAQATTHAWADRRRMARAEVARRAALEGVATNEGP